MPIVPHLTYLSFRDAVLGRYFDLDGSGGAQCWDAVQLLYTQADIGQYLYTIRAFDINQKGYVKTCWTDPRCRQRNGSGHFIQVPNLSDVRRGDIVVLDTYYNQYGKVYGITGHIAFADEDYNGQESIDFLGQNQGKGSNPYTGKAFNIVKSDISHAFLGAFRYTAWNGSSPTPPTPQPLYNKHRYNFVLFNRRKRQEKWTKKLLKRR